MTERPEFTVTEHYPDGSYSVVGRDLMVEDAVKMAARITKKPAVLLGVIVKVMITDGGDLCCFLWEHDKGVVFPPPDRRKENQ